MEHYHLLIFYTVLINGDTKDITVFEGIISNENREIAEQEAEKITLYLEKNLSVQDKAKYIIDDENDENSDILAFILTPLESYLGTLKDNTSDIQEKIISVA